MENNDGDNNDVDDGEVNTTINSCPSNPSFAATASFGFIGISRVTPAANLVFECRLDRGAWAACTSPKAYSGLANGSHKFAVRAKDAAGNVDVATYTWAVSIASQAPVANAGGPYTGFEGAWISLSAAKSTDPNKNIVSYKWDLNNDGRFNDAFGKTTRFFAIDNGIFTVRVRVTDATGLSSVAEATVTAKNVPPTINLLKINSVSFLRYRVYAFVSFKDPGMKDTFSVTWTWGDNTTSSEHVFGHIATGSHTYDRPGTYWVTVTIIDKDGGVAEAKYRVSVLPRR